MFKVRVPKQKNIAPFTGISHGLKFVDSLSEGFSDLELKDRLVIKGYILEEESKDTPISKMKLEELKYKAEELGIEIPEGAKVDDIRTLVKVHLENDN